MPNKSSLLLILLPWMCALLAVSERGWSQDAPPRMEIYGGYSLLNPKIPADTLGGGAEGEAAADVLDSVLGNLAGWRAGATFNVTRWLGISADFTGHYKSLGVSYEGVGLDASADLHTFQFGPRFTHRGAKVSPYFHVLLGVGRVSGTAELDGETLVSGDEDTAEYHFSGSVGGGVEVPITRNVVLRAVELDYFPYVVDDSGDTFTLNNLRWGSSISLRF